MTLLISISLVWECGIVLGSLVRISVGFYKELKYINIGGTLNENSLVEENRLCHAAKY